MNEENTVLVEQTRYESLIASEKELQLLKTALSLTGYCDIDRIREIFNITKEK